MHPQIGEIVSAIIAQRRFVYLCTNALLYKSALKSIRPSPYFCFVVHLDGLRETHDIAVERKGVYDVAIRAIREFREAGFRVCTNTTLFSGNEPEEYHRLFAMLNDMGVEGMMVAPGFQYKEVAQHDIFMQREEARSFFGRVFDGCRAGIALLQQPALPRLPGRQARLRMQPVVDADVYARRLAQALLSDRGRAHADVRRADGDDRLEGVRLRA